MRDYDSAGVMIQRLLPVQTAGRYSRREMNVRRKMIGGLVLAAILCMLSVFAAADGIQVMDTEGNETTLESYIDGHDSIILYGRTICGNCNSFLKGIKTSLKTLSHHGIRVISVEEHNEQVQTAEAVKE